MSPYFLGKDHGNAAGDVSGDHYDDEGNDDDEGNADDDEGNGDDDQGNGYDKGKAGDAIGRHHGGGYLKPQCSKPGLHLYHLHQQHHHNHHFIRLYQAKEHPPLTPQLLPWPWFTR